MVAGSSWMGLEDFDLLDTSECLGSFTIQPVFPGRSSHICTSNILVKRKYRKRGVGTAMAQCFISWAMQLGYYYSLFSLVYDCNVAACKILHKLGFQTLSVLKGAGILKGFSHPVDAFIFGRMLEVHENLTQHAAFAHHAHGARSQYDDPQESCIASTSPDFSESSNAHSAPLSSSTQLPKTSPPPESPRHQTEEFESMRIYLLSGKYPPDSNRTERTRIRSRSRAYYVLGESLMYKRTEVPVVSDPEEQLKIALEAHLENHNGINKLQKVILTRYFWQGVRETITRAIRMCSACRAAGNESNSLPNSPSAHISSTQFGTSKLTPVLGRSQESPTHYANSNAYSHEETTSPHFAFATLNEQETRGSRANGASGSAHVVITSIENPQLATARAHDSHFYNYEQHDPGSVVYLPPENEDDEYLPDDVDLDMGLGPKEDDFDDEPFFNEDDDWLRYHDDEDEFVIEEEEEEEDDDDEEEEEGQDDDGDEEEEEDEEEIDDDDDDDDDDNDDDDNDNDDGGEGEDGDQTVDH